MIDLPLRRFLSSPQKKVIDDRSSVASVAFLAPKNKVIDDGSSVASVPFLAPKKGH